MSRHEALRTTFEVEAGEPWQRIHPLGQARLSTRDLSNLASAEREGEARRLAIVEANTPFDLQTGPLFRATLLQLDARTHVLLLTLHHIVFDGWSTGVLLGELESLYTAQPTSLPPLPIQYADYARWQRDWLAGSRLDAQLEYWKTRLRGVAPLELPCDRPRPAVRGHEGATIRLRITEADAARLRQLAQELDATLFMCLAAVFEILLARHTGQTDICIGTPIAGRRQAETEGLVGLFVNTLALRSDLSGRPSFAEVVARIRDAALSAYAHQDVPFERIVDELGVPRDLSQTPVFQVMFALQNTPPRELRLPGATVRMLELGTDTAKFDLSLLLHEDGAGLGGAFEYDRAVFDASTIERMIGHFQTLLAEVVARPREPIASLSLVTDAEARRLVSEWAGRPSDAAASTIHEAIAEHVAAGAQRVALRHRGRTLTYGELDRRARVLAAKLDARGIGPESIVGVHLPRSFELVVAIVAVLQAGGAYLPLEPGEPAQRIAYLLADSGARLVLTTTELALQLPESTSKLCLDDPNIEAGNALTHRSRIAAPSNLAYINYTSGSTGRPKGVEVSHAGLAPLSALV